MNIQPGEAPFLSEGLEVSAKFKGAFCEATIKKIVKKDVKINVLLKEAPFGSSVIDPDTIISGPCEVNQNVIIKLRDKNIKAVVRQIRDCSRYWVEFDDGDEKELNRNQVKLKGKKHFAGEINMDEMPLNNPDKLKMDSKNENGDEFIRPKSDRTCRAASIMSSRSRTPLSNDNNYIENRVEKIKNGSRSTPIGNATDNKYFPFDLGTIDNYSVGRVVLSLGKENDFSRAAPSVIVSLKAYKAFSANLKVPTEDNEIPLISFVTSKFFVAQQESLRPFNGKCLEFLPSPSVFLKSAYSKAQAFIENGELPKGIEQQWVYYKEKKISSPKKKDKVSSSSDVKKNGYEEKEIKVNKSQKNSEKDKDSNDFNNIKNESETTIKMVEEKHDLAHSSTSDKTPSVASFSSSEEEEEDAKEYIEKKDNFIARFYSYAGNVSQNFVELPLVTPDEVLDIYKLTKVIVKLGGARIRTNNKWPLVYKKMHLEDSNLSLSKLIDFYDKYLHGFLKVNKNLGWSAADSCKDSYGFTKRRVSNALERKVISPQPVDLPPPSEIPSIPKKRGRKPKEKINYDVTSPESNNIFIDDSSKVQKEGTSSDIHKSPEPITVKTEIEILPTRSLKRERRKSESVALREDDEVIPTKRKYTKRKNRDESEFRETSSARESHEKSLEKDKSEKAGRGKSELDDSYCRANIFTVFNVGQKMLGLADDSYWDLRVLSFNQPDRAVLVRRIKEICGPDLVFNKIQKKLLKGIISKMNCYVHYLRWNSRYDQHLGLDRIYLLKTEQAIFENEFSNYLPDHLMKEIIEWCNSSDGIKSIKYSCYESDDEEIDNDFIQEQSTDASFCTTSSLSMSEKELSDKKNDELEGKKDFKDKFLDKNNIIIDVSNNKNTINDREILLKKVVEKKEEMLKDVELISKDNSDSCEFLYYVKSKPIIEKVSITITESKEKNTSEMNDDINLECNDIFEESPELDELEGEKGSVQLKSGARKKGKRLNQYIPSEIRKRRLQNPQYDENEELIYECPEPCVKALLKKYDEPVTEDYLKVTTIISDDEEFEEIDKFLKNESLPTVKIIDEFKYNKDIITEKLNILRQYYTKNWLDLEEEDDRIMKYLYEKEIGAHRRQRHHEDSPTYQVLENTLDEECLENRSHENGE
uniref:ARID domain-containing protein n=1 Tax=Parastrongyloides trichosuri TaxID=131310 RepID=A0A0N4ZH38_PARTI